MNIVKKTTSPVQETEIKKKAGSYNTYTLTLSWGQLEAIRDALALHHADPLADEFYEEISFYMAGNVPLPGEDKSAKEIEDEDEKSRKDSEGMANDNLDLPDVPDEAFEKKDGGDSAAAKGPEAPIKPTKAEAAEESLSEARTLNYWCNKRRAWINPDCEEN